jgi:hypothetical protein
MSEIDKLKLNLFEIVQISQNNDDLLYICELCKKSSITLSIFDSCNHSCCIDCVDSLYDSYFNKDSIINSVNSVNSVMFICPFCDSKVNDIIYKK